MLSEEREHKSKLPGVKIPEDMEFTTDMEKAVKEKDFIVLAVPSPFTRSTARKQPLYYRRIPYRLQFRRQGQ